MHLGIAAVSRDRRSSAGLPWSPSKRPQNNVPLFSCPICAKFVTVVAGSASNSKPSSGAGVNGGLVAGVVMVSSMRADVSAKSPLNVEPLVNDRMRLMPLHSMRRDFMALVTSPMG